MHPTSPRATGETPRPYPASHYLLAYLEEGRVCVYAARRKYLWVGQQLPEKEERRLAEELHELHRTPRRTSVVDIRISVDGTEFRNVRVLCVRT